MGVLAVVTVGLLGMGAVQNVVVDPQADFGGWRLIMLPLQFISLLDNADNVPLVLVLLVAAGLVVTAVMIAAWLCVAMVRRVDSGRVLVFAKVVSAVLVAGAGGMVLLALVGVGIDSDEVHAGSGAWWFAAGVALFAALVRHPAVQRLWYAGS